MYNVLYIVLVFHRIGVGRWDVAPEISSLACIVVSTVSVIACLYVGVLNVGRALEDAENLQEAEGEGGVYRIQAR
jgi:hypothetical protein